MSCRPDDVMSRAIFEVRAFLAGPASHVGSTALLPRIITTIGIGPRLSLAFVGSPLLPLISATSGSWPRWGGRGHVFSIPTLPERGSPMIFDPPWVTVLPDSDSLERFLADPAEHTGAGAVELRLDFWASPPSLGTIASIPVPSIVTWRRGAARESERLSFLKELLMGKGGDLWLDLDVEDPAALRGLPITIGRPDGVRVLMSRHFEARATDAALRGAARNLLRPGVDAAKLVVAAGGLEATLQALRLSAELSKEGRPIVVFAAGIGGTASRFLAGGTGRTWWGYGRTRGGTPVVAGQPVVATIGTRYGGGLTSGPSGAAGFAAVIGSDVSRSLSPGFTIGRSSRQGDPSGGSTSLSTIRQAFSPMIFPTHFLRSNSPSRRPTNRGHGVKDVRALRVRRFMSHGTPWHTTREVGWAGILTSPRFSVPSRTAESMPRSPC